MLKLQEKDVRMARFQLCVALAFSALGGAFAPLAADEPPRTEIRFAIASQFAPYESRNEQGELVGLNIELGNALCQQLNVQCTWVDQLFVDSIPTLEARRFDAIMGMAPTPQRRLQVDFTQHLYPLSTRLVGRRGSELIPTVRSLKGKRIGVLAGSNREAFALSQWAPAGVTIKSFWLNDQLVRSLVAGEIDATLQGALEIHKALLDTAQGHAFDFLGEPVTGEQLGKGVSIAVRKADTALRDELDRALEQLKHNGEYQRITAPYRLEAPSPMPASRNTPRFYPGGSNLPSSEVVRVGNLLYLSDILGLDERGHPVRGGAAAQTRQAMNMLRDILARHESSMDQVVKCSLLLTDLGDLPQVNVVYLSYFAVEHLPALSVQGVRRLPGNATVAVECIAVSHSHDEPT